MTRQEFIDKAWNAALAARERGAAISVPIAVAQAALETNFGDSELAQEHNNLFGIKGSYDGASVTYDTKEQAADGTVYTTEAGFKSYPSWTACFEDYADIIKRLPWYEDAEDAANVPRDYLRGLIAVWDGQEVVEPGWATDRDYFNKVWSIVESYYLLQRSEVNKDEDMDLIIIYDGQRKLCLNPKKSTLGMTKDGEPKLMVRVEETTFWQRLRYLLG